jgi:hypothetical protein
MEQARVGFQTPSALNANGPDEKEKAVLADPSFAHSGSDSS